MGFAQCAWRAPARLANLRKWSPGAVRGPISSRARGKDNVSLQDKPLQIICFACESQTEQGNISGREGSLENAPLAQLRHKAAKCAKDSGAAQRKPQAPREKQATKLRHPRGICPPWPEGHLKGQAGKLPLWIRPAACKGPRLETKRNAPED